MCLFMYWLFIHIYSICLLAFTSSSLDLSCSWSFKVAFAVFCCCTERAKSFSALTAKRKRRKAKKMRQAKIHLKNKKSCKSTFKKVRKQYENIIPKMVRVKAKYPRKKTQNMTVLCTRSLLVCNSANTSKIKQTGESDKFHGLWLQAAKALCTHYASCCWHSHLVTERNEWQNCRKAALEWYEWL